MQRYVNSTIDVILDRTADELIGGILVALLLALGLAGAFSLLRRKITDTTTLITVLALAANLAGMALAAGFVRSAGRLHNQRVTQNMHVPFPPPAIMGDRGTFLARSIFERADTDRNGLLSTDEAAEAAVKFVKESEAVEGGSLNEGLLRSALRRHIGPPPEMLRFGPRPGTPGTTGPEPAEPFRLVR